MAYTKKKAAPANHKLYIIHLTSEECQRLTELVRSKASKQKRQRAEILLKANIGDKGDQGWTDELIAECLACSLKTVQRIRKRCVTEGLEATLKRKPQKVPARVRKLDGRAEARVIAMACGKPPEGRARWTYRLLAEKVVELEIVDSISYKTVWATLKKTNYSLI